MTRPEMAVALSGLPLDGALARALAAHAPWTANPLWWRDRLRASTRTPTLDSLRG